MINTKTFKSLEFILLVLTNLAVWLSTMGSTVSSHDAWLWSAASAGVYALARGLAKMNTDTKNFWQTTEFWIALLGAAMAALGAANGHISDGLLKELLAGLTALSMIARGLAKAPSTQVSP